MSSHGDLPNTGAQYLERRKKRIANEMRQLQNDVDHWNRTHPDEEPITFDADLTADVAARRRGHCYEGGGG